jgi:hypothetical protein
MCKIELLYPLRLDTPLAKKTRELLESIKEKQNETYKPINDNKKGN